MRPKNRLLVAAAAAAAVTAAAVTMAVVGESAGNQFTVVIPNYKMKLAMGVASGLHPLCLIHPS